MNFRHLAHWQEKAKNLAIEMCLFIDDEYCAAADNTTFETIDPAAQQTLAQVVHGKKADVERAARAARQTFDNGDQSQASPARRKAVPTCFVDLMETHCEGLALLETLGIGKPIRHSPRDGIPGVARAIRWYVEALDKVYGEVAPTGDNGLAMTVREPINVIAAVAPWNFSLLLACRELGPTLVASNSVILKPSEKLSPTALCLARLAKKAGLSDGMLSVISGFGHEAGQVLALYPDVEVITFTGSIRTDKRLLKDAGDSNMKRAWLEAGGKSVNIVFANCSDLQKAANVIISGTFYNQGQMCIAGTHLLPEESITDEFLTSLRAQAQHWQPGNPFDSDTTMGMLINNVHADNVYSSIRDGKAKSTLFLDGWKNPWPAAADLAIFVDVDPASILSREEIFGPVLVVTRFKSEEQALQLANDSDYSLGAAVWTRDLSRAHRMSRRLKVGSVFVNNYNDGDMTVPFGGYKQSGNGYDKPLHALEGFTELKTTWIALGFRS